VTRFCLLSVSNGILVTTLSVLLFPLALSSFFSGIILGRGSLFWFSFLLLGLQSSPTVGLALPASFFGVCGSPLLIFVVGDEEGIAAPFKEARAYLLFDHLVKDGLIEFIGDFQAPHDFGQG
jgi:hypothetical protein